MSEPTVTILASEYARLLAAEARVGELTTLVAEALAAWEGTGAPIEIDRLRAALGKAGM